MNPKEQPEPEPEPAFQLPPPPPGIEWHRKDGWKAGDLPQGYRPHTIGEVDQEGDEVRKSAGWIRCECLTPIGSRRIDCHRRTTRPLTFSHLGKTWTWHKAGDPCPCDGERKIHAILAAAGIGESAASTASRWRWTQRDSGDILGWRYAEPATKTVNLGPEDVPPGSVFRMNHFDAGVWILPCATSSNGISYATPDRECEELMWSELNGDFQINRSIPLTGRWHPDAWEPCSKEVPA